MRGGSEHSETSGAAHRRHHVPAMAEGKQWKFDAEHLANRRFHGCVYSCRGVFGAAGSQSNGGNASASLAGMPSVRSASRSDGAGPHIPVSSPAKRRCDYGIPAFMTVVLGALPSAVLSLALWRPG